MTGRRSAVVALSAAALGAALQLGSAAAHAQEPICPEGTYWNAANAMCIAVDVYVNPPNPVVGPVGPAGVGGVVGPVGPGPVGPGPVGPGPVGHGPR